LKVKTKKWQKVVVVVAMDDRHGKKNARSYSLATFQRNVSSSNAMLTSAVFKSYLLDLPRSPA